jgi:predicted nucleic acid-binding protein
LTSTQRAIARGEVEGVLSSVAIAEVLVLAARSNDGVGFERAAATIRDLGLRIVPLDAPLAEDVAWIRGRTGMAPQDAIHVASARACGAPVFVTDDRRIPTLPRLDIAILDDLVA